MKKRIVFFFLGFFFLAFFFLAASLSGQAADLSGGRKINPTGDVLLAAAVLPAQPHQERVEVQRLSQPWRFHSGDDLLWKNPAFDDSGWTTVLPSRFWTDQGIVTDPSRFAWYRLAVSIETDAPLYIYFPNVHTAAEVFVDGTQILQAGVPGDVYRSKVFEAPSAPLPPIKRGQRALIAVRVWLCYDDDRSHLGGGISEAPELGTAESVGRASLLRSDETQKANLSNLLIGLLGLFLSLVLFFCWRRQPNHSEYGWYAGMLLGHAVLDLCWYGLLVGGLVRGFGFFVALGYATSLGCSCYFFRSYFKVGMPRWFQRVLGVCLLLQLADFGGWVDWYPGSISTSMLLGGQVPILLANAALLIREGRQGNREAWTLAFPYFVYTAGLITKLIQSWFIFSGAVEYQSALDNGFLLARQPISVSLEQLGLVLGSLAMTGILLNRFTRTALEGERLAKELEAARQVQELLLPSSAIRVPGFAIEGIYLPATEVGGDFYQILPGTDGSVLVVVADVSGKGLKAAMIVSAAVGAIGMTRTRAPGALLTELNEALAGRIAGGFVTCSCVRFEADGSLTVANAGHPAPYVGGRELSVMAGLPLGVVDHFEYMETRSLLHRGDLFSLVSDGVVEAADAKGELFGFERTREISVRPAREIAEAAKAWGQNDDITVVTVRRAQS